MVSLSNQEVVAPVLHNRVSLLRMQGSISPPPLG